MPFLKVFAWALALLLLPGCVDTTVNVSGEVLEYQVNEYDRPSALVILTEDAETVGLVPQKGEEQYTFSWLPGNSVSKFREKYPYTVMVNAKCKRSKTTMTRQDGTAIPAYVAEWVMDGDKLVQPGAYTFSDGVTADLWEGSFYDHSYTLSDRTELLRVEGYGPENVAVGGVDSLDTLDPVVQKKILAFYEEQGLLYDEFEELEKAYSFYKADPEKFQSLLAGQDIAPTYANDHIITFVTTVTTPLSPGYIDGKQLHHTFDRKTGERIGNYDLFTVGPEGILDVLLHDSGYENWENAPTREEMLAALKPEYISLSNDYLSVHFPAGTIPGQEHGYGFGKSYFGQEWDILQPWAQPDSET